jgi:hypothetical protein
VEIKENNSVMCMLLGCFAANFKVMIEAEQPRQKNNNNLPTSRWFTVFGGRPIYLVNKLIFQKVGHQK